MNRKLFPRGRPLAALVVAALAAGCGSGRYPVEGRVAYEDGSPLAAGTVVGEATVEGATVSVQGNVEADGRFALGTERPGDGALPGSYKFAVMPLPIPDGPAGAGKVPSVDGKYSRLNGSGITFDVKPERNVLNITVSRWKGKPAKGD